MPTSLVVCCHGMAFLGLLLAQGGILAALMLQLVLKCSTSACTVLCIDMLGSIAFGLLCSACCKTQTFFCVPFDRPAIISP